jgi:hypothetical protein
MQRKSFAFALRGLLIVLAFLLFDHVPAQSRSLSTDAVALPSSFFSPFSFFGVLPGCPVQGRIVPVDAAVGSGATLISAPAEGPVTLAIKEGGQLGLVLIESVEPANRPLTFQLVSPGRVGFGFVGGGTTGRVRLPVFNVPFVLYVSDDQGHLACLHAIVLAPGIIWGVATSN